MRRGYLFGQGTVCCKCGTCVEGSLPPTITVTFHDLKNLTNGPPLILLEFASCFGGGAAGTGHLPDGTPGPLAAIELTSGGAGYAVLARVEPEAGDVDTTDPAVFTITMAGGTDSCGRPYWYVASVAVTPGGSGYVDNNLVPLVIDPGTTEDTPAAVVVRTVREPPSLSASGYSGSGAVLVVSVVSLGGSPETWAVSGVAVTSGGVDYIDGSLVVFSADPGSTITTNPEAYLLTVRGEPTVAAEPAADGGSGGTFTVMLRPKAGSSPPLWEVDTVTVDAPGSGYTDGDDVVFSVPTGVQVTPAAATQNVSGGWLTGATITDRGEFYRDTGVIDSVVLTVPGVAFGDSGEPSSAEVAYPGVYFDTDPGAPPIVAGVTVTLDQTSPSAGTGAVLSAVVDDDPLSATFGQITSVTIDDAGTGYLAHELLRSECCGFQLDGVPLVLYRIGCYYWHDICANGRRATVIVFYPGPDDLPVVGIHVEQAHWPGAGISSDAVYVCSLAFVSEETISNCDLFEFDTDEVATTIGFGGRSLQAVTDTSSVTVEPGGDYDEFALNRSCEKCCDGHEDIPEEITISVTDHGLYSGAANLSGDYVLSRVGGWYPRPLRWCLTVAVAPNFWLEISISPTDCPECGTCGIARQGGYTNGLPGFGGSYSVDTERQCPFDPEAGWVPPPCESTPLCRPPVGYSWTTSKVTGGVCVGVDFTFEVVS